MIKLAIFPRRSPFFTSMRKRHCCAKITTFWKTAHPFFVPKRGILWHCDKAVQTTACFVSAQQITQSQLFRLHPFEAKRTFSVLHISNLTKHLVILRLGAYFDHTQSVVARTSGFRMSFKTHTAYGQKPFIQEIYAEVVHDSKPLPRFNREQMLRFPSTHDVMPYQCMSGARRDWTKECVRGNGRRRI